MTRLIKVFYIIKGCDTEMKKAPKINISPREVSKEMKEHPWMNKTQATRLVRDHAMKKKGFLYNLGEKMFTPQKQTHGRKGSGKRPSLSSMLEKSLGDLV